MLRPKRGSIRPRRGRDAALGEGGDRQREPLCTASLYEDAQADAGRGMSNKDATPVGHHQATEEWMRMEELRTMILFQATTGRATREHLQAALWADLEALDG